MSKYFIDISQFHLLLLLLLSVSAQSQVGTVTQDITTLQDFTLQKQCAQSCFIMSNEYCPMDLLGIGIDCATLACGDTKKWKAKNDCYCRLDSQQPARDYLDGCIEKSCSGGDHSVDLSMAESIYLRYCEEKGYSVSTPAPNEAVTTGSARTTRISPGGGTSAPTGQTTSQPIDKTSSSSGLSMAAIIGIAVAGLAGLILIGVCIWFCRPRRSSGSHEVPYNQLPPVAPIYPPQQLLQRTEWNGLSSDSEITPNDSASQVGMHRPPPLPPTVVSVQSETRPYNMAYHR